MPFTPVRVAVLGPVTVDGRDPGGTLMRALLVALAHEDTGKETAKKPRSAEAIAGDLWGDTPPQNPRASLQSLVSRLRAVGGRELIVSGPAGYALGVPSDLGLARHLAREAEALSPDDLKRRPLLDEALSFWRGDPGMDIGDSPIAQDLSEASVVLRAELEQLNIQTLITTQQVSEAIIALRQLAVTRPFDEALHATLMQQLAAQDRIPEALNVYAALRERLRDELGTSPGSAIGSINAKLLQQREAEAVSETAVPVVAESQQRIGLPASLGRLIGRSDDLAAVSGLLQKERLVTILGPGGLGKTRLSQAAAAEDHAPTVIFVPLASVRDNTDVPLAIAATLGISEATASNKLTDPAARPDLRKRVIGLLGERPVLLVLDNCEQVIEGVATWAADMLASVPSFRVLATSRTPLGLLGEQVFPLAPLTTEHEAGREGSAVRLFVERAQAVRPSAVLDPVVVARLCEHLDGLPLAIELAAARIRTMSPEQIEDKLQDRFALLKSGDRSAPERHRTLQAVIDWSWELLDNTARNALATLSLLPGGFSSDTAAGVLDTTEIDADDLLDSLVAQSLLVVSDDPRTGGVRFRMLETVREFGLAQLAGGGDDPEAWEAVNRWARAFAAEHLGDLFSSGNYGELRAEHNNLIAVLRHALTTGNDADAVLMFAALCQSWFVRGAFSEMQVFGTQIFTAAARIDERAIPVDALAITLATGAFQVIVSGEPLALRLVARLRRLRRNYSELSPVYAGIADLLGAMGSVPRMLAELDVLRASDNLTVAALGEQAYVQFAENSGDPEGAMVAAERSWELAKASGSQWLAAMSASSLTQLNSQLARAEESILWWERAEADFREFGTDEGMRHERWLLGGNFVTLGRFAEAREVYTELLHTRDLTEDGLEYASIALFGLGEVARAEGDLALAAEHFERAVQEFRTNEQRNSPWFLMALAGLIAATSCDGSLAVERIEYWVQRLRSRTLAMRRVRRGVMDQPVFATALVGWSAWAMTQEPARPNALEMLMLARHLGPRQDLPSLHLAPLLERAEKLFGSETLERVRAETAMIRPEERIERAFAILAAR
ncbi:hypothetical protein G7068_00850 [Leucobacter viscericola]|uniref:Bacterial transcriptional activator domain-containing protein n=1 Tax=Leucobacter viscericola TaxID=2714935 RepID=A0A6G7XBE1_9MICO|nr:BTAD domain-containing putative transcriptional regulator [Leucobacter viscericola]QIK61920.1 hypothetical protein G7068_00850 [Leucobacter viscericola]